jgi:tetratricopeptide (TPR) repeat protein
LAADPLAMQHRRGHAAALFALGLLALTAPVSVRGEPEIRTDCAAPVEAASDSALAPGDGAPHHQASACYDRAVIHEQAGRYNQAIADFTFAIKLDPDWVAAFAARGVAYDQKGLYDRAISDYSHAIAATDGAAAPNPELAETYFNRGAAYEHRRLYRQAAADYRAALKLDPNLQPPKDGLKRLDGGP